MVEIDGGTVPISRADISQTSFERKLRAYLTAYAAKHHELNSDGKRFAC
ncbi:MAG: hypothetical protein ABR863_08515 [Roseiarcus sp.]|jgi:hypothetical protein